MPISCSVLARCVEVEVEFKRRLLAEMDRLRVSEKTFRGFLSQVTELNWPALSLLWELIHEPEVELRHKANDLTVFRMADRVYLLWRHENIRNIGSSRRGNCVMVCGIRLFHTWGLSSKSPPKQRYIYIYIYTNNSSNNKRTNLLTYYWEYWTNNNLMSDVIGWHISYVDTT